MRFRFGQAELFARCDMQDLPAEALVAQQGADLGETAKTPTAVILPEKLGETARTSR